MLALGNRRWINAFNTLPYHSKHQPEGGTIQAICVRRQTHNNEPLLILIHFRYKSVRQVINSIDEPFTSVSTSTKCILFVRLVSVWDLWANNAGSTLYTRCSFIYDFIYRHQRGDKQCWQDSFTCPGLHSDCCFSETASSVHREPSCCCCCCMEGKEYGRTCSVLPQQKKKKKGLWAHTRGNKV